LFHREAEKILAATLQPAGDRKAAMNARAAAAKIAAIRTF
jgi:hypothetical protein